MSEPLRFALAGAGRIGSVYATVLSKTHGATLTAVVEPDDAARVLASEQFGVAGFATIDELDRSMTDAVVICSPPATHVRLALDAMARGIHVLCEKPLCIDSREARMLLSASQDAGVTFTMASKFRYVPDIVRAREIVASGAIGDVLSYENTFASNVGMSGRWNATPEVSGGGVLIDNGTHSVDVMRYFFGPIASVQAVAGPRIQNLIVEDNVHLFAVSRHGIMGRIDLSWSIDKQLESFIRICGSKGTIAVGWKRSQVRLHGESEWTVFGDGYARNAAFTAQIENFAAACRGEEDLLVTAADALASVEVIEAAYESLRASRWIAVVPELQIA